MSSSFSGRPFRFPSPLFLLFLGYVHEEQLLFIVFPLIISSLSFLVNFVFKFWNDVVYPYAPAIRGYCTSPSDFSLDSRNRVFLFLGIFVPVSGQKLSSPRGRNEGTAPNTPRTLLEAAGGTKQGRGRPGWGAQRAREGMGREVGVGEGVNLCGLPAEAVLGFLLWCLSCSPGSASAQAADGFSSSSSPWLFPFRQLCWLRIQRRRRTAPPAPPTRPARSMPVFLRLVHRCGNLIAFLFLVFPLLCRLPCSSSPLLDGLGGAGSHVGHHPRRGAPTIPHGGSGLRAKPDKTRRKMVASREGRSEWQGKREELR